MKPLRLILVPVALIGLALPCPAQTVDDYIALIEGCRAGDLEAVKAGLAKGIHIDQPDGDYWTPLCHALDLGQEEVARYLISQGASVNVKAYEWQYLLNFAILACPIEIVELLLDKGANPDPHDSLQWGHYEPPVAIAISYGKLEALKALKAAGAPLEKWEHKEHNALSLAALHNNEEAVRYLVSLGMDPNKPNPENNFPLTIASLEGHLEVVQALLAEGADPNLVSTGAPNMKHYGAMQHTALIEAVRKNSLPLVELLLKAGADPNALNSQAIKFADRAGNRPIHDLLLAHGGKEQRLHSFMDVEDIQPRWVDDPKSTLQSRPIDWGLTTALNRKARDKADPATPLNMTVGIFSLDPKLDNLESLLTAQLSQMSGTKIVERGVIRKIMSERALTAASLSKNEVFSQAGQILGADALILLGLRGESMEARLVSTSTGLVIATLYSEEGADPQAWAGDISNSLAANGKMIVRPPGGWSLVSIPKIRASQSTPESLAAEAQFSRALALHLGAQENIFILDREEMNRLSFEKSLNPELREFYRSGWVIDGNLELAAANSNSVTVHVRMRSPASEKETRIEESGELGDAQGLLSRLTVKLVSHIKEQPATPYSAQEEATVYLEEAKTAFSKKNWDLAHRSADAAWALGRQDEAVLNMRVSAIIERINTARFIIKNQKIDKLSGARQILAYRAPLLLPEVDSRELSAREYIELSETLLTIYEQIAHKEGAFTQTEKNLIWRYNEAMEGIQAPLELMHSLSDESLHSEALESIRNRARKLTSTLVEVCKARDEVQCAMRLMGVYLIHLSYWERNEELLYAELEKRLTEVSAWQEPYSKHTVFYILEDFASKKMKSAGGQAGTAWQRLARRLIHHPEADAQLLGYTLVMIDTSSNKIMEASSVKMHELAREIIQNENIFLGSTTRLDPDSRGDYRQYPRAGITYWFEDLGNPHLQSPYHTHLKDWKAPQKLSQEDQGSGKIIRCKQYDKLYRYYNELWFRKFSKSGAYARPIWWNHGYFPENVEPWIAWLKEGEPLFLKRLEASPYDKAFLKRFFQTDYLQPLEKIAQSQKGPDTHVEVATLICDGLISPLFIFSDFFSREFKQEHLQQHSIVNFNKVGDEVWIGMRPLGFLRLMPDKTIGEAVKIPEDSRFYGYYKYVPNAQYIGKNYIAVWFVRLKGKSESHLGVFDRRKNTWKTFPLNQFPIPTGRNKYDNHYGHGLHDIIVLNECVYFSYLLHPSAEGLDENILQKDSLSTIGISRIHLESGKEEVLVSKRRSPSQSPLDGTNQKYYPLTQISETRILCHDHVWDEEKNEWVKATETERKIKRNDQHAYQFGTHRLRGISTDQGEDSNLRIQVVTLKKDPEPGKLERETHTKRFLARFSDWPQLTIPSGWVYMADYYNRYRDAEKLGPAIHLDEGGLILSTKLGFYFFTPHEVIGILDQHFPPDDSDWTEYDSQYWHYRPLDE